MPDVMQLSGPQVEIRDAGALFSRRRLTVVASGRGRHLFQRLQDPRLALLQREELAADQAPDLYVFSAQKPDDVVDALDDTPAEFWARLARGPAGIVFDASGESWPRSPEDTDLLHQVLDRIGIAPERAVLVTQNRCCRDGYERRAAARGAAPMAVLNYDLWIRRLFARHAPNGDHKLNKRRKRFRERQPSRSKRFISLNLTPRVSKVLLLQRLMRDGLWDQGFISFGGFPRGAPTYVPPRKRFGRRMLEDPHFGDLAQELSPWLRPLDQLGRVLFLHREVEGSLKVELASDAALPHYNDSWFSIITESEMSELPLRITEKPFSALMNFHPLVMFGNPGSLALIRSFGFETFGAVIDESYDEEPDPRKRFEMAYREVERLCRVDEAELARGESALHETLQFNAQWGLTRLPSIYRDQIDVRLVDDIIAAVGL